MITLPTTFVIGAGASQPYGWPLGAALMQSARDVHPQSAEHMLAVRAVRAMDRERQMSTAEASAIVTRVVADIRQHPARSIDAYLETRQRDEQAMRVGRLLLAILLGESRAGRPNDPPINGDDWLGYVFDQMLEGAPTAQAFAEGNANVRFVTFNFDSVIEQRLSADVRRAYPGDDIEPDSYLLSPVIHVHGRLPDLPASLLTFNDVHGFPADWSDWPIGAAQRINVILDDIDEGVLQAARQAVQGSIIVCFLGFHYAKTNLTRIGLTPEAQRQRRQTMFGSAFGFSDGERARVAQARLPNIELAPPDHGCLATLRRSFIFRD